MDYRRRLRVCADGCRSIGFCVDCARQGSQGVWRASDAHSARCARPELRGSIKASRPTGELDRGSELVRVTLRPEWYAEAMMAISDQHRDDDLLTDLLVEVAGAFVETGEL